MNRTSICRPGHTGIRKKIWRVLPAISLFAGTVAALALRTGAGLDWTFAVKEGALLAAVLCLTTALAQFVIRAYPTKVGILGYALAAGLVIGGIASWLHGAAAPGLLSAGELEQYTATINRHAPERWMLYLCMLTTFSITIALYRRMDEIERRYALQQDASALLKEAELFKLRQQLQPHFLYNSLNAVSALIITSPDQAGEMISRLADFLRASVKQGRSELVPLGEELDYLRTYLWIEAVRFGDRLCIDWVGAEDAAAVRLPPFLLQPLMENAIRFGVYGRTGAVTIRIHIVLQDGMLRISIRNPYDGSMKAAGGTGFGLEGIRRRLYLVYARQDLLQASEADGHFTTTIQIPQ